AAPQRSGPPPRPRRADDRPPAGRQRDRRQGRSRRRCCEGKGQEEGPVPLAGTPWSQGATMAIRTVETGQRRQYPGVRSVVKVQRESDGTVIRTVIAEDEKRGRRKVSRPLRRFDKRIRNLTKAENVATSEYLRRHDRSNRRKKNGALKDLGKNVRKAVREGADSL